MQSDPSVPRPQRGAAAGVGDDSGGQGYQTCTPASAASGKHVSEMYTRLNPTFI